MTPFRCRIDLNLTDPAFVNMTLEWQFDGRGVLHCSDPECASHAGIPVRSTSGAQTWVSWLGNTDGVGERIEFFQI